MSRLVVISPGLAGSSHELGTRWVTIGRSDGNDFQIVDTSISGRHCEVRLRGNELDVRDLRSTNGTFIGGKTVIEGVVQPGQTLRVGEVELNLEITAPDPAASDPSVTAHRIKPAPVRKPGPAGGTNTTFRVLFVDDSMAFLETIGELFGDWGNKTWEIHTAVSADKALAVLEQKLMDLVVLDIGMPLLDGVQLLGIIHQQYPNVKIVVLTGQGDESRRADCLAHGAELFLEKPTTVDGLMPVFNMLNALVTWTNRDGYSAPLGEIGLSSIIQMECLEGKSSVVEVRNSQTDGEIFIEAGAIVHAATGRLAGEKAFHQLLSLTSGEFSLKPFRLPPDRTLQGPWEELLAKADRVRSEGNFSTGDDDTILIVKKAAKEKTVAVAPPAPASPTDPEASKTMPANPAHPKVHRSTTSGMNILSWEEMVEADTDLISKPDGQEPPSDNSQN
jgi:CheY-like chemotaxis protein